MAEADAPPEPLTLAARLRARLGRRPASYFLCRFAILRLLGLIYLVAFLILAEQGLALIGHDGLLPADQYLARVLEATGSRGAAFWKAPTLFWLGISDGAIVAVAWIGVALSALVVAGLANGLILAALWATYLSVVHIGQLWYGYGWEILLCETGFLAIFLVPLLDPRPFSRRPPPVAVIWLHRWLVFRIMLGAGLIKLRGDPCWRELTCLYHHYETQPNPHPLSPYLHFAPHWTHQAGVLYNFVCEIGAPWLVFGPRLARHVAGLLLVAFQGILILSGNLSFLNWLTIVPILACFDDSFWRRLVPGPLRRRAEAAAADARPSRAGRIASWVLAAGVALLSISVVANLVSEHQIMNTSFEPFEIVNTYGAFGSVGAERHEVVFEGTSDAEPGARAAWKEYGWKCKPSDPRRPHCLITPYHHRLDWQIWFAAMEGPEGAPWTLHLIWKLLHNDRRVLGLLAENPFPDAPPRFIRARLYRYEFAPPGSGAYWQRTLLGVWLPPLWVDRADFREALEAYGWAR